MMKKIKIKTNESILAAIDQYCFETNADKRTKIYLQYLTGLVYESQLELPDEHFVYPDSTIKYLFGRNEANLIHIICMFKFFFTIRIEDKKWNAYCIRSTLFDHNSLNLELEVEDDFYNRVMYLLSYN